MVIKKKCKKTKKYFFCCIIVLIFCKQIVYSQENKVSSAPYEEEYKNYVPDFLQKLKDNREFAVTENEMERSSEVKFYTLNEVEEVNRANALVKVAIENESSGDFRKAMSMYQDIINKFSISNGNNEVLFRVSSYGVFVPIAQYCQRRLLNFPSEELAFYRTLRDPEAKELYEEAVKKFSLELFSEIVDRYLATSYGGRALLFLGDAALDRGNYLEALEYFQTIKSYIPDKSLQTPDLVLKIQLCEKALDLKASSNSGGVGKASLSEKELQLLKASIQTTTPVTPKIFNQKNSNDYVSGDDYTRFPVTTDVLGLTEPEWDNELIASRNDYFVYAQPVVTDTSIIVRMKNIIYCYSIINGNLRWKNDIGGRANWIDWFSRQYPLEDLIVQDGVVVTPIFKGGSSLIALDEITGQVRWSYGPMNASDGDQMLMRFECAPSGGPGTIYANYVLDNIKGDTHIDTEYGVIAFESTTGRVKWRRQICRLQPGKFDGSFGTSRRNRIRSFSSPPLYHEGTVYVNTNAGAVVAMDSLSGRIKWLMRYIYYLGVHDLTRQYGELGHIHGGGAYVHPHTPMFWLNQRPLVIGEQLYILPVDSPFMYCLDRKTGKINWSFSKPTGGFNYLLGPISTGELVISGNGRAKGIPNAPNPGNPLYLIDPKDGKITWKSSDYILQDTQPVMTTYYYYTPAWFSINNRYFENGARPFLMENDHIILTSWTDNSIFWRPGMQVFALGEIDLKNKTILGQRRYYSGATLAHADTIINDEGPNGLKLALEELRKVPKATKEQEKQMKDYEAVLNDTVPVNKYPAFMSFSRLTFNRFGVPFELRITPRKIQMVYSRPNLETKLANDNSLMAIFTKSELAVKDGEYKKASEFLNQCLVMVSPEDVSFRSLLKQQFYRVYLELVRSSIRGNQPKAQLENALGMSNTASVLSEEIETLFALSEGYIANKEYKKAATCLKTLIEVYTHHEYPVSTLIAKSVFYSEDMKQVDSTLAEIFTEAKLDSYSLYKNETHTALDLVKKGFPLYLSTVSPLSKELSVRTGDIAVLKLLNLLKANPDYEAEYSKSADTELSGDKIEQLLYHITKYPGTAKGQAAYDRISTMVSTLPEESKRDYWRRLAHIAKICKFKMPSEIVNFIAVSDKQDVQDVGTSFGDTTYEVGNFKDPIMLTMERGGDGSIQPNLLFISVKLPKKVGYRFSLVCFDMSTGKEVWRKEEFRLKDLGNEPGFFKAYLYKDIVVVHGIYNVFAFNLKDGSDIWKYQTPDNFDILEATMSGNLFVLSGASETIALQVDTKSPVGEVAWQQKEDGNLYYKPYFVNDLLISVRKYPFNITSRYRTTGNLVMRLALPDLSLTDGHPIFKEGSEALPVASYGQYLMVTDNFYVIIYDVVKMEMLWKTPLLNVDVTKEIKLRATLNDKYLVFIKEDYDRKAIYCYDMKTGDILWYTDPANSGSPQAIYSLLLEGDMLYGIGEFAGQGFRFVSYDCIKGVRKVNKNIEGYGSIPQVRFRPRVYGKHIVAEVQDRKDFQVLAFDKNTGEINKKVEDKGDGPIGDVGRVGMSVQGGHPILFSKTHFKY